MTRTIASRFGRYLAINATIALALGVALFALHVGHQPHTAPHKGDNYTAATWGNVG